MSETNVGDDGDDFISRDRLKENQRKSSDASPSHRQFY